MAETTELTRTDDVARLRADIEQTRANMGDTLNAIQERLSPERLKAQAKESIREATIGRVEKMAKKVGDKAGDASRSLIDVARENPVPLALIGIGAGWLLYNSKKRAAPANDFDRSAIGYESAYTGEGAYIANQDRGIKDKARESVSNVAQHVSDAASGVSERVGEIAGSVSGRASDIAGSVGEHAHRAEERASSAAMRAKYKYEETPWVGAAVAIALGAAAGLSIPSSRREQELMGDHRDQLIDRARELGREKLEAVRRVAEGVVEETREAVREHVREEGLVDTGVSARANGDGYGL